MLKKIAYLLSKRDKKLLVLIFLVILGSALLDLVGISSIIPVIEILEKGPSAIDGNIILRIIESNDNVHCFFADRKAIFTFDRTIVSTSLVVGAYPDTRSALNRKAYFVLEVNSNELINAISSLRWDEKDPTIPEDKNITNKLINGETIDIDAAYVDQRLSDVTQSEDLSRYIL